MTATLPFDLENKLTDIRYYQVFENLGVGLYRASFDGKQRVVNPALVKLSGLSSKTELCRTYPDLATEWYVDASRQHTFMTLLRSQGHIENFESEIYLAKRDKHIWISENAWLVYDDAGRPVYYEGSVEDITERKETELFQQSLLQFVEDNLERGFDSSFYQRLLERAVNVVPGAQAGSILIKDDVRFGFAAAVGFDLDALQAVKFYPDELYVDPNEDAPHIIDCSGARASVDPQRRAVLEAHGRLKDIQATLTTPIFLDNEVVALLQFNSFERTDVFGDKAAAMAATFAKQVASLLRHLMTEKELLAKQARLERWATFRTALMSLMSDALLNGLGDYQAVLERAVEVIPGAQAGSILLLNEVNRYSYVAALKHNLALLQRVEFEPEEIFTVVGKGQQFSAADIGAKWTALSQFKRDTITAAQGGTIKGFLVVPIIIHDKVEALLNLDTFSDTFGEDALEMANAFAAQIAVVKQRLHLEQRLEQSNKQLLRMANYDLLTGLPNRGLFADRVEQLIHEAKRKGEYTNLLYIDLDGFKDVNDSLGHSQGDALLVEVARRLKRCVRDYDTVARLSGDEFAVVLGGLTNERDGARVAKAILTQLAKPFELIKRTVQVSASIGIASCPTDGASGEVLLKNADLAMYHAKAQGRNRYHYFKPEMNTQLLESLELEEAIREGIRRDEFSLVYQPRVDLLSGQVTSFEALLRWHHPVKGQIPPSIFIPLAEKSHLICDLGELVLVEAIAQTKRLHAAGIQVRMAVNLSVHQLLNQDLVKNIKTCLEATDLDPSWLELELTESAAMDDVERTIAAFSQLRALGVYISIDDFGTGYSSLNYLKRLPVNSLKIDRSFVCDIGGSSNDLADTAIVEAIIALGKSMNYTVIAEGVETAEQVCFLKDLGCHEAQGYFFSKPVAPSKIYDAVDACVALVTITKAPQAELT